MKLETAKLSVAVILGLATGVASAAPSAIAFYGMKNCSCCRRYVAYLQKNDVRVSRQAFLPYTELTALAKKDGVPAKYTSEPSGMHTGICHFMVIDGYVIVGHVPVRVVDRLIEQHPANVAGIVLPGMPQGSPGMTGKKAGPFVIYAYNSTGKTWVYAKA
ncbi:MAG: DUF411 domain-containing protein [Rhodanobacteraceae bacterium]